MVERKPQGMSWETWVERRLREAREQGAFEDLAGLGKPLEARDHDPMTWVRDKARVRDLLTDLTARIDAARRGPQIGPPVRTPLLDAEEQVAAWRAALPPPPTPPAPVERPRRRWRRR